MTWGFMIFIGFILQNIVSKQASIKPLISVAIILVTKLLKLYSSIVQKARQMFLPGKNNRTAYCTFIYRCGLATVLVFYWLGYAKTVSNLFISKFFNTKINKCCILSVLGLKSHFNDFDFSLVTWNELVFIYANCSFLM